LKQAANLSALMLGGSNFVRVRCHAGSDIEVQYDLMTFGIPTNLFPVSMTGEIDLSRHRDFLQQQKTSEASVLLNKALALVETPIIDDCIALVEDYGDEQDPETDIDYPSPVMASAAAGGDPFAALITPLVQAGSSHHNHQIGGFHHQQQHRSAVDFGYNNNNNNNNNMQSTSFNDIFCFNGNHNPMQVESSMQQQQQRVNHFPQQQLGMNTNTNKVMGLVQQYLQHQVEQHQDSVMSSSSKTDIPFSTEPVLVPGELDILLGRGRCAQNHTGNIHYRQVVETFRFRYEQIPKKGAKTHLIREVVAVIYDNGGRFLKQDGFGRWIPVDPEVARDKVSHSFRNQKRLSSIANGGTGESSLPPKKRSRADIELHVEV